MQSLSKNQQKLINSLKYKKYRHKHGLFIVEGTKVIKEFLKSSYKLDSLFSIADIFTSKHKKFQIISPKELKSISLLSTPQAALAVFQIKENKPLKLNKFTLVLDGVRDPGNLGTIIRLCDWFGVTSLLCSADSVDCYNPKCVQASMGSLTRVKVYYDDLQKALSSSNLPIYGADMQGESVYQSNLPKDAILILGSESHGISEAVNKMIIHTLSVPQFGKSQQTESLNVAMACSILLSEFKRRTIET